MSRTTWFYSSAFCMKDFCQTLPAASSKVALIRVLKFPLVNNAAFSARLVWLALGKKEFLSFIQQCLQIGVRAKDTALFSTTTSGFFISLFCCLFFGVQGKADFLGFQSACLSTLTLRELMGGIFEALQTVLRVSNSNSKYLLCLESH